MSTTSPDPRKGLNRREALRRLAIGGAGVATLPSWVETLSALAFDHAHTQRRAAVATAAWKPKAFTPQQNATVVTLTELIIPQTDTPGAKAAKVNQFIDAVLADAEQPERDKFLAGLAWIDDRAKGDHQKTFVATTPEQQTALLTRLSAAADAKDTAAREAVDATGRDFFIAIKSMTITGYYTSEVGMREELGDDGTLFFAEFKGCTHPEHQQTGA